jgi:poly(3-hydroxybutyrate) depolymerase
LALAAAALGAAGCSGGTARHVHRSPFAYDRSAPLGFQDRGRINHGYPIAIRDVSFASPKRGRVSGFVILPPGPGRHPAVIYVHGSGGTRADFLLQASWMAARGAVGLTLDSPFDRATGPETTGLAGLAQERDLNVQNIVELRRAVDVLQSRPDVDPRRIGYLGYSAGAKAGAILAGVDHRVKAFDLMSGGALPVRLYVEQAPRALRGRIRRLLDPVDPLRYVGHAAPSALFFQDGLRDRIVPHAALVNLSRSGSRPKRVRWYAAGHPLNRRAYHDQLVWLAARLGLAGPVVPGAVAGP